MEDIMNGFKNPPAVYRPAPLWVWNDEMTDGEIDEQLAELSRHGFGGAFVHPRPGLISGYLDDDWFARWAHALEAAKKLGMKLYIYDENSYPSGFAGGEVSAALPDCLAEGAAYEITKAENLNDLRDEVIAAFQLETDGGKVRIARDLSGVSPRDWSGELFLVVRAKAATTGWLAGFAYVDLMRPEAQKKFIETTYEKYYEKFGADFGGAVPAIFTDEPYVGSGGVYGSGRPALPFSNWLANEFRRINGYSLLKNLPCVFRDVEGDFDYPAAKVRFDYYRTIHELWTKNWIGPNGKWCAEHGINWTGHYLEHQWPHVGVNTSPSMQANYEFHQWPAIDMLLSSYLRDAPSHALALTIRELRSAVNQFGKERALCELYGAGGWDSTFEDYKRMGDWVLVNGVNFINQHLTYATIAGARKRDHPQSFDWREPWWNEYTAMNDYLGRASYLLTRGKMEQRILVLNPSTTGYLVPYEEEKGEMFSAGGVDAIKNPDMTAFLTLSQKLTDLQWDFDYGDEFTLARHAKVADGKLAVAEQEYSVVIASGDMKNMLSSTIALLKQCASAGVRVLFVGKPGPYVDGLVDGAAYENLAEEASLDEIDARLAEILPRRLTANAAFPEGFAHMRRALPDGETVWFFVNHSMGAFEADVTVGGGGAAGFDLFAGEQYAVAHAASDGKVTFRLSLQRNQSAMIVAPGGASAQPEAVVSVDRPVALEPFGIRAEQDNVMPIERVDLGELKDVDVLRAADLIFSERGFLGNPWDNKVQYRGNILSRNALYGPESGFRAAYRFMVAEGFMPKRLAVAAERPALCRLVVNGKDAPWNPGETFLDRHIGVTDIEKLAVPGENVVEVVVDAFDARFELEPIYLTGDFAVEETGVGWVIAPPKALKMGAWGESGMPFYPHAVLYEYAAHLSEAPRAALIAVSGCEATAISATVNGAYAGLFNADGERPLDISAHLKSGENRISIRVSGGFKNLLGPHFHRARGTAWPAMWKNAPATPPACTDYDFIPYGLREAPRLTID
jgi:hypothetical protein